VRRINVQGAPKGALWSGPHSNPTSFSEREGTRDPGHHRTLNDWLSNWSIDWFINWYSAELYSAVAEARSGMVL